MSVSPFRGDNKLIKLEMAYIQLNFILLELILSEHEHISIELDSILLEV